MKQAIGLSAILFLLVGLRTHAYVETQFETIRDSRIQCDIVAASQMKDGVEIKRLKPNSQMTTFTQYGGEGFVDAKCFISPALNSQGVETTISFGCISLDQEHVQTASAQKIKLVRKEYQEVVDLNFRTGLGRHSFQGTACDWGDCSTYSGEVKFANCSIK